MIPALSSVCFSVEDLIRDTQVTPVLPVQMENFLVCVAVVDESERITWPPLWSRNTQECVEGCSLMWRSGINSREAFRPWMLQFSLWCFGFLVSMS